MKLKPIGERVVVKQISEKKEQKTASGIILSTVKELDKPNFGEILAVGKGDKLSELRIGDKILYSKFSGTDIKDGEDKYVIVNFEDILAIVE